MARVAFIGLGRMGHGMAGRYLDAGFTVAVWNRSKAKAEDLIARGVHWATSPEDAAIDADAVVTMVADDEASRRVWLGEDGAAANMKAGTLAIECSTVSHAHALGMAHELNGRGRRQQPRASSRCSSAPMRPISRKRSRSSSRSAQPSDISARSAPARCSS
jgi:3-hydroxyisobutyrate dehydrogenase-like beta-hydroxyacid dehydrogenase